MTTTRTRRSLSTLALYIRERHEGGYFQLFADPVWVGLSPDERADIDAGRPGRSDVDSTTVRNASTRYTPWQGLHLDGLVVTSQGGDTATPRELYGWEVEYRNVFSVDRRDATRMAKTLTAVERKMERLNARYGRPATFGAYLLRVAAALGATRIVLPRRRQASDYAGAEPRIVDLSTGAAMVDHLIREWAEAGQPAALSA